MHFDSRPLASASLPPRADEEEEDEEETAAARRGAAPVALLIQRKFLEQRKIFLWGAVTDETAKDLTEKLLYLEASGPGRSEERRVGKECS